VGCERKGSSGTISFGGSQSVIVRPRFEEVGHMSDTEFLPKPKEQPEPVRRLEVFTGAGRRRRWTPEEKARIVSETFETGASVSAVARRPGLTAQRLFALARVGGGERGAGGLWGGARLAPRSGSPPRHAPS